MIDITAALQQQQQARKSRRCWSPELHRQFIAALNQLGGPQGERCSYCCCNNDHVIVSWRVTTVTTLKQIKEVMKVDGLTNDEVNSHLQVSSKQLTQDSFQSQDPVHFVSNLINPYVLLSVVQTPKQIREVIKVAG
jgi:hypothetical protein